MLSLVSFKPMITYSTGSPVEIFYSEHYTHQQRVILILLVGIILHEITVEDQDF